MTEYTEYHVAVDHLASPDPDSPMQVTTTYLGTCEQAHVDEVRAIAALEDSPRLVKKHPHIDGAFCVLRDDYDLDVYVPVGALEYRVYPPDPHPKTEIEGVDLPRGASGPAYISGAVRFGDQSIGGAMDYPGNPPRVTWHTTESPSGRTYFYSIAAYLIRIAAEPQVIYDPDSDLLGQFGPLTQSGRALRNDGARRTNREGKVNIQVEVLGKAASPWTKGFDPAARPNYRKLIAAGRAHGVPDVWPAGKPPATAAAAAKGSRNRTTWQTKGGHYAHAQVPGNDHWDPGAIDIKVVPGTLVVTETGGDSGGAPVVDKDAFPGASKFGPGANNAYVTRLGQMLVLRGAKRFYTVGPGPKWGLADKNATRAFQQAQGWTGTDADGIPGATTWKLLVDGKGKDIPALPRYEPYPGSAFFHGGRHSPLITAMGRRLVAEGCGAYRSGPGPNWTNADRESVKRFQKKRGFKQTGIPDKATWDALKIPNV
ncbi:MULTISPECIES: peptidoglycan-binding protein [unclassified Streptomyces]|uniref:peptidoglycan-binding protein n=1 Tax=unclassified Streptomyces TaxID=2593676 RepID=UPI0036E9A67C